MRRREVLGLAVLAILALAAAQAVLAADKACDPNYDNFGKAFVAKYCLGCHTSAKTGKDRMGAPKKTNFDAPADIKKAKADIVKMTIAKPAMPPMDPKPTDDEKAKLKAWLDCEYSQSGN